MTEGTGSPFCLGRDDRCALQAVLGLGLTARAEEHFRACYASTQGVSVRAGEAQVGLPRFSRGRGGSVVDSAESEGVGLVEVVELGTSSAPRPPRGYMDILVDDIDCIASPFEGGTELEQAAAFGWLVLVASLLYGSTTPEVLRAPSSPPDSWRARCSAAEYGLLRRIGRHTGLRLRPSASFFSFCRLLLWIRRHAVLVASGRRLRLCTRWLLAPARKLAATIDWMAMHSQPMAVDAQVSPLALSLATSEVRSASFDSASALAGTA